MGNLAVEAAIARPVNSATDHAYGDDHPLVACTPEVVARRHEYVSSAVPAGDAHRVLIRAGHAAAPRISSRCSGSAPFKSASQRGHMGFPSSSIIQMALDPSALAKLAKRVRSGAILVLLEPSHLRPRPPTALVHGGP